MPFGFSVDAREEREGEQAAQHACGRAPGPPMTECAGYRVESL
jgi:hypothetical protein